MKYLILFVFFFLTACATPQEPSVIQGEEVNIYVEGYEEMCKREPESALCAPNERINWYLKKSNDG